MHWIVNGQCKIVEVAYWSVKMRDNSKHSSSSTGTVEALVSGHPRDVKTLPVAEAGRLRGSRKQQLEL